MDHVDILLVEDNDADARLARLSLAEAESFSMRRATSLAEALRQLSERPPDLVLLDLHLPDSHGLDTLAKLRVHTSEVPVIVFTFLEDDPLALAALQQGAQDYLVKGALDPAVLRRSIRHALERHGLEQERLRAADRLRQFEKDREMDRLRRSFVNMAAHELRTPLTPLRLQLHRLQTQATGPLTPEQTAALASMARSVGRLAGITEELVRAARMQAEAREPTVFDIGELVEQAAKDAPRRQPEEEPAVERKGALETFGDEERFTYAVHELIGTAHSLAGTRRVHVSAGLDRNDIIVRLMVRGLELPASTREAIITPFTEADEPSHNARTPLLRLYLSRVIIEEHGGSLWCENRSSGLELGFRVPHHTRTGRQDTTRA